MAANTFRETVRERVLYNLVFFAILMTLSGLLLGQLSVRQDERIIKDIALASMDLFGTMIAVFIGVGLVSKEIERRSLYPLLAKPVSRGEFLLGRFAGLCFTLLVNLAVMAAGLLLTLVATGRVADPRLLLAVYGIYLALVLTVAVALLFSTLTSAPLAAVGTVCAVVAGRLSDVVRGMGEVAPEVPGWLVFLLTHLIPDLQACDFKDRVVHGDPVGLSQLGSVTLYAGAYAAVVLSLAVAAFRRRDLK